MCTPHTQIFQGRPIVTRVQMNEQVQDFDSHTTLQIWDSRRLIYFEKAKNKFAELPFHKKYPIRTFLDHRLE